MRRKIISNQLEQIKRFNQNVCCFMTAARAGELFGRSLGGFIIHDVSAHGSSHFQNNEISIGQRVENKHSAPLWKYFARPEAKLTTPIEFTFAVVCVPAVVGACGAYLFLLAQQPSGRSDIPHGAVLRMGDMTTLWLVDIPAAFPLKDSQRDARRGALSSSRCSHYILPFDASSARQDRPLLQRTPDILLF
jgi:hypothetical protein